MVDLVLKVGDKNIKLQDEKKKDPRKIPKRLTIKLITNIEKFKRANFDQKMLLSNPPGDRFLFFMKYYKLKKEVFRNLGYTDKNKALLFCSRDNVLRTAVKSYIPRGASEDSEYTIDNINFIVNELFAKTRKIRLNSENYSIYSSYWNQRIYKTNNPNVLQIDIKLILAKGDKISSFKGLQLNCQKIKSDIAEDVDLLFNNLIDNIASIGTSVSTTEYDNRNLYNPSAPEAIPYVSEVVKTIETKP